MIPENVLVHDPDSSMWRARLRQEYHRNVQVWISLGIIVAYSAVMFLLRLAGS